MLTRRHFFARLTGFAAALCLPSGKQSAWGDALAEDLIPVPRPGSFDHYTLLPQLTDLGWEMALREAKERREWEAWFAECGVTPAPRRAVARLAPYFSSSPAISTFSPSASRT